MRDRAREMATYKTTAKVGKDGQVVLENLPFANGVEVEVTVESQAAIDRPWPPEFPLEGSVIKYDDPLEPACPPEEWEAIRETSE